MSHIVEARTSIENPNLQLLRQAVEVVAGQHAGGEVSNEYYTFSGQKRRTTLAIFTDELRRGIAIQVKEGKLVFVGDSWGYDEHYKLVQQQILQTYVSLATLEALRVLGYQATAEDVENQIVLTGVTYA